MYLFTIPVYFVLGVYLYDLGEFWIGFGFVLFGIIWMRSGVEINGKIIIQSTVEYTNTLKSWDYGMLSFMFFHFSKTKKSVIAMQCQV